MKVSSLMSGRNAADNTLLHGGEEVRVPEEGHISVLGDVKHPGVFAVKTDDDTSLMTLLARSEGLDNNASAQAFIYRSLKPGNPREEVRVELRLIMDRKASTGHTP